MQKVNNANADVYTDFNGLANLKTAARKSSPQAVKEVAKQFEAIFVNNVLKGMREAKLADGILDNDQSKFYNDMYDQQIAVHLSGKPGVGLADLIVKQLSPDDKDDDNKKMGLEDYLNRSSSSNKTISHPSRSAGNAHDRDQENRTSKNLAVFKSYLPPVAQAKEYNNITLKNSPSQPIKSAEDFVKKLTPYATQAAKELGVDPKVLLAQAALETGWGRSVIKNSDGSSSFNLFNIKSGRSWQGNQAKVSTLEYENGVARKEMAGFRSYSSYQQSFNDYVNFIKNNPRYGNALQHAGNSERYLHELQRAGYATDPSYANKIMKLYHGEAMAQGSTQSVVAMK